MAEQKSLGRRVAFWLLLLVLVLVAALLIVVGYLWWRVPTDNLQPLQPGKITISATGAQDFGGFRADITGDSVTITRKSDGLVIWRSDPGTAFLSASVGSVSFEEHFGYFWADVNREAVLPDQSIDGVQAGDELVLSGSLSGQRSTGYRVAFTPTGDGALVMRAQVDGATSVMITTGRESGEAVHGLGEQYRPFDLSGSVTPLLPREQGLGRGSQPVTFLTDIAAKAGGNLTTTYAAWPSWVTSKNRAVRLADNVESGAFAVADLSEDRQIRLESWSPNITANLYVGKDPVDVIVRRGAGQERPPLADWVQEGAILGLQGGTERVRRIVADMQQAGAKIAGVWLQDWTGRRTTSFGDRLWWTWQLDEDRYPGWEQMVADFEAQGIKTLTYINPWLVPLDEREGAKGRNLYREAEEKGYLVKNAAGEPYRMDQNGFDAVLVDFTNPSARDWYADVIAQEVIGNGASGFMADFGESLPYDGVLYAGSAAAEHNRYPQLWASVVQEGCLRAGMPDCVAFMRSAYLDSARYTPMMWAGDQMVDYTKGDGLASAILGMHAGGVSGSPLWHSDVGGYTSLNVVVKDYVRPDDLNQRWAEMEAFGVMMRTHEGNRPAKNEQVYDTPETREAFARMTRIYAALADYRKAVVKEAVETGVPARRHPWLVYPQAKVAKADLQFFLGEHLMVAPVVSEKADSVEVTFPPGTWVHVLTGEEFEGDQTTEVAAPLGTPAAFVERSDPIGQQIIEALKGIG